MVRRTPLITTCFLLCSGVPSYAANTPQIINHTDSIVVESVNRNHSSYQLILRNKSNMAIYGVAVAVFGKHGNCDLHMPKSNWGWFIDPLGTRGLDLSSLHQSKNRLGSCSDTEGLKSAGFRKIVIGTVDFENGNYEGNKTDAALLEANRLGRESQYARIDNLVVSELNLGHSESVDWTASLLTNASALSDTPNPEAILSIENRFGSVIALERLQEEMRSGSMWAKVFFTNNVKIYALVTSKKGWPLVSLRTWWESTKGACDYYLSWCRDEAEQRDHTASAPLGLD